MPYYNEMDKMDRLDLKYKYWLISDYSALKAYVPYVIRIANITYWI